MARCFVGSLARSDNCLFRLGFVIWVTKCSTVMPHADRGPRVTRLRKVSSVPQPLQVCRPCSSSRSRPDYGGIPLAESSVGVGMLDTRFARNLLWIGHQRSDVGGPASHDRLQAVQATPAVDDHQRPPRAIVTCTEDGQKPLRTRKHPGVEDGARRPGVVAVEQIVSGPVDPDTAWLRGLSCLDRAWRSIPTPSRLLPRSWAG